MLRALRIGAECFWDCARSARQFGIWFFRGNPGSQSPSTNGRQPDSTRRPRHNFLEIPGGGQTVFADVTRPQIHPELIATIVGWIIVAGIPARARSGGHKKTDDPKLLLIKRALTLLEWSRCISSSSGWTRKVSGGLDYGAVFFGAALVAANGLYFAAIWRKNVAMLIARPFGNLYDGGDEEVDPQAFYSSAEAKRKRGHYAEAIADIRAQLAKFPTDLPARCCSPKSMPRT